MFCVSLLLCLLLSASSSSLSLFQPGLQVSLSQAFLVIIMSLTYMQHLTSSSSLSPNAPLLLLSLQPLWTSPAVAHSTILTPRTKVS